jgi:hypothetical protein
MLKMCRGRCKRDSIKKRQLAKKGSAEISLIITFLKRGLDLNIFHIHYKHIKFELNPIRKDLSGRLHLAWKGNIHQNRYRKLLINPGELNILQAQRWIMQWHEILGKIYAEAAIR